MPYALDGVTAFEVITSEKPESFQLGGFLGPFHYGSSREVPHVFVDQSVRRICMEDANTRIKISHLRVIPSNVKTNHLNFVISEVLHKH